MRVHIPQPHKSHYFGCGICTLLSSLGWTLMGPSAELACAKQHCQRTHACIPIPENRNQGDTQKCTLHTNQYCESRGFQKSLDYLSLLTSHASSSMTNTAQVLYMPPSMQHTMHSNKYCLHPSDLNSRNCNEYSYSIFMIYLPSPQVCKLMKHFVITQDSSFQHFLKIKSHNFIL